MRSLRLWMIVTGVVLFTTTAAAGDIDVKPYGFVLFNAGFNDHIATDIPFKAAITDSGDATSSFTMLARQSRFGLEATGEAEGWQMTGTIELDFWGRKGSGANGASMQSAPRLRLANFALAKENIALTFGQDWTQAFAPLNPNSLAHVSITVFSGSGNLWNRMPQIRLDYTAPMDNGNKVMLQLAAVRPLAADVTNDGQPETLGAGEASALPFGQARVSYTQGKKFTVGASAHVGQEDWNKRNSAYTEDKTSTWAVAGDLSVKAGTIGFNAEAFLGSNLNMLFSGAGTFDASPEAGTGAAAGAFDAQMKREGMDVMGGWGEITIAPTDSKVKFHVGAGTEILDEDQIKEFLPQTPGSAAYHKNMTMFGNVFYSPLPKVTVALEVGYITTTYKHYTGPADDLVLAETDGTNLNLNAGFKLAF